MFPKDISLPYNKVLPKEINWFLLRNAIDQASFPFYEGKWNEENVKAKKEREQEGECVWACARAIMCACVHVCVRSCVRVRESERERSCC